jgi:membrane associated rhomboid family serine protease
VASPKPRNPTERLHWANVEEFRQQSILYGLATLGVLGLWVYFGSRMPLQMGMALLGLVGIPAGKAIYRWWEWSQAHPRANRMHPDRVAQIEQQTVKVMSDAVKSRAWFTRAIVICVGVPSILELVVGLDRAVAVAAVEPVAIRAGEWWRLLGGTYLHGSYYHFAGNMGALLVYGSILESKTSRLRLPLVYLLSCVAGSAASVAIPPDVPSIGASGGVVGVIGYLFLFSRRQEVKFPAAFRGATASVFAGLITAGAFGFWYIDNPGHAGGALAGIVLAGLVVDTARNFGEEMSLPLLDFLGWIAAALLVAGSIVTSFALFGVRVLQ